MTGFALAAAGRLAWTHLADAEKRTQGTPASAEEALLARLRAGDERAFEALIERHHATMLAVARTYVRTQAVAEVFDVPMPAATVDELGRIATRLR